jgi:hypothetical protein
MYMAGQLYCVSRDVARWIKEANRSDISGQYEDASFGKWLFEAPFAIAHVSYFRESEMFWRHNVKGEEALRKHAQRNAASRKAFLLPSSAMAWDSVKQSVETANRVNEKKNDREKKKEKALLLSVDCSVNDELRFSDKLKRVFRYNSIENKKVWSCKHKHRFVVQRCNMLLPRRQ